MIMSNSEKDEFIRKRLAQDTLMVSGQKVQEKLEREIDESHIRVKKYTYGERRLIMLLIIVLMISLGSNAYLIMNRNKSSIPSNIDNQSILPEGYDARNMLVDLGDQIDEEVENEELEENRIEDTSTISDTNTVEDTNTIEDTNTSKLSTVIKPAENKVEENVAVSKEIDEDEIKNQLTNFAISIGRYGEDANELEKNTILLLIANNYFNDRVTKNTGLEVGKNSKYAMTANNVHLYLKELVGMETGDYIPSYTNYMKYNTNSKFYSAGSSSNSLNEEKYELSNIEITASSNNELKVTGNINRKSEREVRDRRNNVSIENVEANYDFTATLVENKNYTYSQYKIADFKAELLPGESDNINRLVPIEATTNVKR